MFGFLRDLLPSFWLPALTTTGNPVRPQPPRVRAGSRRPGRHNPAGTKLRRRASENRLGLVCRGY